MTIISITRCKETPTSKVGISFGSTSDGKFKISKIADNSIFANTELQVGQELIRLNGVTNFSSIQEIATLLSSAPKAITIQVQAADPASTTTNTTSTNNKIDEINAKMIRFCPELASKYAKYPLKMKSWVDPNAMGPNGSPCWISAPKGSPLKLDYAFGAGRKGFGYYHLLTRDSYNILYARLTHEVPGGLCGCACTPAAYKEVSEWDDVKTIVYNRSVASIPDDAKAKQDAIDKARGVAQAHYHAEQNFQLAVGVGMNVAGAL